MIIFQNNNIPSFIIVTNNNNQVKFLAQRLRLISLKEFDYWVSDNLKNLITNLRIYKKIIR